jgi:O-antigen/teichoic acid export membrane protein
MPLNMTQIKNWIAEPLYRNSLFLMANIAVTAGLGFFFWMVVARFYTEKEVGLGSAIIAAVSLLAAFSKLGVDFTIIRFLPRAEKPAEMINSCFTLSGIVALAVAGIFIAGLDLWSPDLVFVRENAIFILAFVLFVFGFTLSGIMDFTFIAKRKPEFALIMGHSCRGSPGHFLVPLSAPGSETLLSSAPSEFEHN